MCDFELSSGHYLNTALQSMEQAQVHNRDRTAGLHIARAIDALRALQCQVTAVRESSVGTYSDPHELNEFNSAI